MREALLRSGDTSKRFGKHCAVTLDAPVSAENGSWGAIAKTISMCANADDGFRNPLC
jgi:hypothetical protein